MTAACYTRGTAGLENVSQLQAVQAQPWSEMFSASSSLPPPFPKGRQEIASFALEETDDISVLLNKDITRFMQKSFLCTPKSSM